MVNSIQLVLTRDSALVVGLHCLSFCPRRGLCPPVVLVTFTVKVGVTVKVTVITELL